MRRGIRSISGNGVVTPPPTNTVPPSITQPVPGVFEIGDTLTGNTGTWLNATSFEYRWNLRGTLITGATASTYQLLGVDLGGVGPALTSELFGDALFSSGQGPTVGLEVRATGPGGTSAWVAASNEVRFDWAQYASQITQLLDERGITASGGFVDAWANQGSVVTSFTQTLTVRPATGRTINGFTAPDFDGVNDRLDSTATCRSFLCPGTTLDNTRYLYLWRVADVDAFNTAADGVRPSQLPDVNSGNCAFTTQKDAAGTLTAWTAMNANVAPTGYRASSQTGTTGVHFQETRLGGGAIVGRWDGADGSSATFNGHTTAPGAGNTTRVGANYSAAPGQFFNGAIGTEIAWAATVAITSKQLNTIRAVLAGKYNVTTGYTYP